MSESMKVVPKADPVKTGVNDVKPVAKALTGILADTYRLVFKTHAYHWNVEGALFYSIHHLTEQQYENMFAAADEVAERIRALGQLTPMQMSAIMASSVIEDLEGVPSAQAMIDDLAKDHEKIAKRLHAVIVLADEHQDPVTADLMTGRSAFHEKAAWMLRATGK